ncbi:MAG TPA: class I SAM-dependent methyltransferase, partial [Steroidobacteraceae bacterium]|nr:class I SAM-dependent methyltransferase [Steroidobacteraceae bacterium]
SSVNQPMQDEWLTLDRVRSILNGKFISRPGVFAWDRVDVASALLTQHLPDKLQGSAADLGAGYGYLSDALLTKCPGITTLAVYEAEHRALQLAKANLAKHESQHHIHYCWHDVTSGLLEHYDVIVTNPPFHAQGSMDRPDIGRRFITIAAQSLRPGGQLWLVANRHLPYEAVLVDGFQSVNVVTQQQGFKIVVATRAAAVFSRENAAGKRVRK